MKTLLIVYHSMTGGTLQMAHAARDGARAAAEAAGTADTLSISFLRAAEAQPVDVLGADGYLFATPENLAAMSGQMKDFFDRSYYAALDRINGKPYAVLICAGSDGRQAAEQIARIATGWRLRAVAEPLIVCTHAQTPEAILGPKRITATDLKRCEDLGATLGAGIALGIF
ncbi:MAG TPA: NAD(P)H-dependent oxidoreductase [Steroidobacteraceae bacterium]|nr:NAD(P)H-dependent oxidoreductase [Steroidobacteraceae bacterium]